MESTYHQQGRIELPANFEQVDIDHLVVLIADMLERLIAHNDQIPLTPESLTRFHSRAPPSISVLDYLRRIVKFTKVERTCLLITLHYVDQMCNRFPRFTLSSLTCHRFILTSIVVASKAFCDIFTTNAIYAKVGGIRTLELNSLEKELLNNIDWRLQTTRNVLDAYYVNLIRTHSQGTYVLAGPAQTSPELSSEDSGLESGPESPASPAMIPLPTSDDLEAAEPARSEISRRNVEGEPSAVLIERATLSPVRSSGPTFEQNMAFEALQRAIPQGASDVAVATATSAINGEVTMGETTSSSSSTACPTTGSPTASPNVGKENLRRRSFEVDGNAEEVLYHNSPRPRTRQRTDVDNPPPLTRNQEL